MTAVPLHRVARRARAASLGFAIALAALACPALGAWAQARAAGADQHDIALPGSESALRDAAGIRVLGPDPEGHAQSHRTVHPVADLGQRRNPDLRAATGAHLPGRRPAAVASGAAAGGRLCRSAAGPDVAGARRRPGPAHLHQPGQFESLRSQHRSRGVHPRRRERRDLPGDVRQLPGLPARIEHGEHPLPRDAHEPEHRPATMSISRSVRCRATIRAT